MNIPRVYEPPFRETNAIIQSGLDNEVASDGQITIQEFVSNIFSDSF